MWTPRPLYGWQNEVSGWLLHCVQAELCHLHELQDEALEERMVPEEHRLPRATATVLGSILEEPKKKG